MEAVTDYIPQLMITGGILLLIIEVVVLGFATFILFFLGLALVFTGALAWMGVMPVSWPVLILVSGTLTAVLAGVLWRPLLRLQSHTDDKRTKSDFEGYRFVLVVDVNKDGRQKHRYSGIEWRLKSEAPLVAGCEVEVVKAEVGVLWVRATPD